MTPSYDRRPQVASQTPTRPGSDLRPGRSDGTGSIPVQRPARPATAAPAAAVGPAAPAAPSAPAPDEKPVSVLGRASLVLDAFDASSPVLQLTELVQRTGLPKSTVHRTAMAMVEHGFLDRMGQEFAVGKRLFELSGLVDIRRHLREAAVPFMQDLYEATHEVVQLGVLDGVDVLYIDKIGGHRSMTVPTMVGGRMPAHCTGLGKALLAYERPEVLEGLMARPLEARTPYTIVVPTVLRTQLTDVLKTGIAYDREEAGIGMSCVAAPIRKGGPAVAAISITGPSRRVDVEAMAPAVKAAALGVSRALFSR